MRTAKLEDTLTQFMQVSMFNHKSTESTIKNLEIQVGQLAKQIAESSSGGFGANTEKNPKEECKVVITRRKRGLSVEDESRSNGGELEVEKEKEGDQMGERKINEVDEVENEKNHKKRKSEGDEIKESEKKKTKSELVKEKKKKVVPNSGREAPYPLVPSKKDKE